MNNIDKEIREKLELIYNMYGKRKYTIISHYSTGKRLDELSLMEKKLILNELKPLMGKKIVVMKKFKTSYLEDMLLDNSYNEIFKSINLNEDYLYTFDEQSKWVYCEDIQKYKYDIPIESYFNAPIIKYCIHKNLELPYCDLIEVCIMEFISTTYRILGQYLWDYINQNWV